MFELTSWMACGHERRVALARGIAERLGADYELEGIFRYDSSLPIARYLHVPSRLRLLLIPGGEFTMGWSDEEDAALRRLLREALRAEYEDWVSSSIDAPAPESIELERAGGGRLESKVDALLSMLGGSSEPLTEEEQEIAQRSVLGVFSPDTTPPAPAPPSFEEIDEVLCIASMRPAHQVHVRPFLIAQTPLGREHDLEEARALLSAWGMRLPSEAEWEYAARATTQTITFRGNVLPDERDVDEFAPEPPQDRGTTERYDADEDELEPLDPYGEDANAFGLLRVGAYPEMCADAFHETYDGAPSDGKPWPGSGPRVVRGGAGLFAPWQGHEWVLMLSAYRQEGDSGWLRPVLDLPQ